MAQKGLKSLFIIIINKGWRPVGNTLLIGLFLALFSACGATYHVKRINAHVLKLRSLGAEWQVKKSADPVVVAMPGKQAVFEFTMPTDTVPVFITKDSIRIMVTRLVPNVDTAEIVERFRALVECPPDTVIVEKEIHSYSIQPPKKPFPWIWLFIAVSAICLAVIVIRVVK